MDLAERPSPEVKVGQLERGGFVSSETSVIKRPEEGVVTPGRAELASSGDAENSKNSSMRAGDGGAFWEGESLPMWREALNSSTGSSRCTPKVASISGAFRTVRNRWKSLKACT